MNVVTTADEYYRGAIDDIESAISKLSLVLAGVYGSMWGAEDYDIIKLVEKIKKLQEILED